MPSLGLSFLSAEDIQEIHKTSVRILQRIGLKVTSDEILQKIRGLEGIDIDWNRSVVTFSEAAVQAGLDLAPSSFAVYGRDRGHRITYGGTGFVTQSILGEVAWVDPVRKERRAGSWEDFDKCVVVADFLPHIDIVGAMIQPADLPLAVRDIHLYAELFKRTRKSVRSWVQSRASARYVLEMAKILAGGSEGLREYPVIEFGFEPVSPLQLPGEALETAVEFAMAGIPITLGPMPQAMATAPVTLAGAVAQGNAECLGTLVILQAIAPGTPVIYYNSPHIMDPRTASLVFSSPEQALLGIAVAQMARHYHLPAGLNVGMTDAKLPDAQAGLEKGTTMVLGAIAGASIFGAMGIAGMDQGFSLPQLIIDDEIIGFVKRIVKGMRVDVEACAYDVIERVGIGGSYLTDDHTLDHWREEFWLPTLCDRNVWDTWMGNGGKTMLDRAVDRQEGILRAHSVPWIEADTQRELDAIVAAADGELLGV